jgi:hypothetical protein
MMFWEVFSEMDEIIGRQCSPSAPAIIATGSAGRYVIARRVSRVVAISYFHFFLKYSFITIQTNTGFREPGE